MDVAHRAGAGFMTLDWDGKIRMDPSSPYAMAGLVNLRDGFDLALGNDADADRHGIVTRGAGLLNPNHYLSAAIAYLFQHRPDWPSGAGIGKTLVSSSLIDRVAADTEVVGIDEGQFFDSELPAVCTTLADQGKRVIVAGLDQDYLGKPFEPMPQLLAIAEYITKTLAICMVCGAPANHTQRLVASSERVLVGAQGTYEARCRHCFDPRLGQ